MNYVKSENLENSRMKHASFDYVTIQNLENIDVDQVRVRHMIVEILLRAVIRFIV